MHRAANERRPGAASVKHSRVETHKRRGATKSNEQRSAADYIIAVPFVWIPIGSHAVLIGAVPFLNAHR